MRIFVVDNNLVSSGGHCFAVDRWIKEEANKRGIKAHFFINKFAPDDIRNSLSAVAIFSHHSYKRISRDKYCAAIDDFLCVAPQIAIELQSLSNEGLSENDLVFFPMVSQNDLIGCALWLEKIPKQSRPYVCMNFMRANFVDPQNDLVTLAGILYRSAAKKLVNLLGNEMLIFTTQSLGIANFLSELLSHPVSISPMLNNYNLQNIPAQSTTGLHKIEPGEYRIAILGDTRHEKGFHLVPEIISLLNKVIPNIIFFVQISRGFSGWEKEINKLQTISNVELRFGALEEDAYFESLYHADIVLLPYHPLLYKYMSSGIFSEAVSMGKVIVAPDSTWMADHIKNNKAAGKVFNSYKPQSITDAVQEAIKDYKILYSRAERYAESWKQEQNVGKYFDKLLSTVV